jgi:hypothetical protein
MVPVASRWWTHNYDDKQLRARVASWGLSEHGTTKQLWGLLRVECELATGTTTLMTKLRVEGGLATGAATATSPVAS